MTLFEVIAEPSRRRILSLLRERERSAGELVARLGVAQPSVSKHLKVLRDAKLVTVRGEGARRIYRLRPEPLAALEAWLAPYRRRYEALKAG
ncbi:MAG TPA: metalloregulator ArsR/SmtB family transcription factor [Caulobacteraceae bacterium]|jgi:DNA-binding transcriptional ArsR family regulator